MHSMSIEDKSSKRTVFKVYMVNHPLRLRRNSDQILLRANSLRTKPAPYTGILKVLCSESSLPVGNHCDEGHL